MRDREERTRRGFGRSTGIFTAALIGLLALAALLGQLGAPDESIGIIVAGATLLAVTGFGIFGRSMRLGDLELGGRAIPSSHGGLAIAAASIGGAGFVGFTGVLYGAGQGALAICLGIVGGFVFLTVLVAGPFRASGVSTVPDLLALRFGGGLIRIVAPLVVIACSFTLLVVEIAVGGPIAAALFGLHPDLAMGLVVGLVLLPVLFGGLRSLATAGAVQYVVVLLAFLAPAIFWSTTEFGFPVPQLVESAALARLAAGADALVAIATPGRYFPNIDFAGINFLLVLFTVAAGFGGMPHLVMRAAAATGANGARRSYANAFVAAMLVVLSAPAYALFARLTIGDSLAGATPDRLPQWLYTLGATGQAKVCGVAAASIETIVAACARHGRTGPLATGDISISADAIVTAFPGIAGLPPLLAVLVSLGALAAILASASSLVFAVASSLGHDLYVRLVEPHAPAGRRLIALRLMMIVTALSAGWLAARGEGSVEPWAGAALSIAAAGIFPVLVLALWWRRCTRLGALSGMVSGAALAGFYFAIVSVAGEQPWTLFGLPGTAVPGFAAAAFGLPVAFLVTILVSLATPREADRDAVIDIMRRPTDASLPQDDD